MYLEKFTFLRLNNLAKVNNSITLNDILILLETDLNQKKNISYKSDYINI